jgi:branched-chain amino acid transport system substrate-binding protein
MRKCWLLALLGLLVVGILCLSGCGKEPEAEGPGTGPTGEPYVIGAIFSVTGDTSSLGMPEKRTAEMLMDMINAEGGINGRPVEIVIEDTKGDPAETGKVAKRLVEANNVLAIVGPSRTGSTLAVVDYMESVEVPLVSCAAGLQTQSITRIASLSDNSGFGKGGLAEIQALMPEAGIRIVTTEEYGPTDKSMVTQLTKIKGTRAQAVVCWGTPPGPAIVAKNMRQLAMDIPLICSHGVANETFLRTAGEAANGVVLPAGRLIVLDQIAPDDPQAAVLAEYAQKYEEEFGQAADTFGGHAWDAIKLVALAIEKAGDDRAGIRDALEQTEGFVGTGGVFNFSAQDHNGLTKDAFVMVTVADGKWKLIR